MDSLPLQFLPKKGKRSLLLRNEMYLEELRPVIQDPESLRGVVIAQDLAKSDFQSVENTDWKSHFKI